MGLPVEPSTVPLSTECVEIARRAKDKLDDISTFRDQRRLSPQSYGRSRTTKELQVLCAKVGHRWVGILMREIAIKIVRTQKFKVTTDSNHASNIVAKPAGFASRQSEARLR
jgi:hypothetical protein